MNELTKIQFREYWLPSDERFIVNNIVTQTFFREPKTMNFWPNFFLRPLNYFLVHRLGFFCFFSSSIHWNVNCFIGSFIITFIVVRNGINLSDCYSAIRQEQVSERSRRPNNQSPLPTHPYVFSLFSSLIRHYADQRWRFLFKQAIIWLLFELINALNITRL